MKKSAGSPEMRTSAKDISDDVMMWFESNARNFGRLKYTGKRMGGLVFYIPKFNLEVVISKGVNDVDVQASFFRLGDNEELRRGYIDGYWVLDVPAPHIIQSWIITEARETLKYLARIEKQMERVARLERKHIRPNLGISGFRMYMEDLLDKGNFEGEEYRILHSLWGVVSNSHDRELKYIGLAKSNLTPVLEKLQSQINLIERLRTQTSGVSRMFARELGVQNRSQTTLSSPAKEAEIVYNESIKQHEQEIHEIKELIEEAQRRLAVIHSTNLRNKP